MSSKAGKVTTREIRLALRERYQQPEWALQEEVANGTGLTGRTYADAVAMHMYPSRGNELVGFEIKISRQDWLKELKKPDKSQWVQQYCDRWFVVAPKGMIQKEEVPITWGLMEFHEGKLTIKRGAPDLPAKDINRPFMAAMLRKSRDPDMDMVHRMLEEREISIRKSVQEDHERALASIKRDRDSTQREYDRQYKAMEELSLALGFPVWELVNNQPLLDAIKVAKNLDVTRLEKACKELDRFHNHLSDTRNTLQRAADILKGEHHAAPSH